MKSNREKALDLLRHHKLMALATVTESGKPQVAIMRYTVTDDMEILFQTSMKTRKYANLMKNPDVAIAIGWGEDMVTMQYEGVAQKVGVENEKSQFKVSPTWVRYWDIGGTKFVEVEL